MENFVGKYICVSSKGFGSAEFIFKLDEIKDGCLCSDVVYIKGPIISGLYAEDYVGNFVSRNIRKKTNIIAIKAVKTIREATNEEIELMKY